MKFFVKLVATFLGTGYSPVAPGTVASFVIVVLRHVLWPAKFSLWLELIVFLLLFSLGLWAADLYSRWKGKEDPRQIVIDEACGQFVAFIGLPASNLNLLLAFLLFRALDIIKPFPINRTEGLPGSWGIMADDLAAGVLTRLLLQIYLWLF